MAKTAPEIPATADAAQVGAARPAPGRRGARRRSRQTDDAPSPPIDERSTPLPDEPVDGYAISAHDLSRTYGDRGGVGGIDLDVEPGTILGLIGPSGCGKTTLLRVLAGVTVPTGGDVRVLGRSPLSFTAADRAQIGYLPQLPVLFPSLSVWRNLNFVASLYGVGLRRRRRLREVLRFVDLLGDRRKRFRALSGGMQRRLALAATLVHDPELLLLDEPTAGVDPLLRERFWEHFRSLRDAGRTLVVATQYVGEAAMCDRVALLAGGRLLSVGAPGELRRQAFGGDLVQVRPTSGWLSRQELQELGAEPWALAVSQDAEVVTVVVEEGADGLRRVAEHLERRGVPVDSVDHVLPSYDDAFVRLIERAEDPPGDAASRGDDAGSSDTRPTVRPPLTVERA
jgi:ABC-2 type transport system ATP-binding protein